MKTKVQNVSGAELFLGFVPPHGVTLADDASVTVDGDLRSVLSSGRARYSRRTELAALDAALAAEHIEVSTVEDPDPPGPS